MVELLRRAIIVWIQLRHGSQLFVGEARCRFQNVPGDSLCTGRRGERAVVGVVTMLGRQEVFYVHGDRRNLNGFVFLWRNVLPESFQKRIGITSPEQDGHDSKVAICVSVNEVSDHVEALPVDVLLTGMVEMKLLESTGFVADGERTARCVIDHDGVAVVDDAEGNGLVIEFELR